MRSIETPHTLAAKATAKSLVVEGATANNLRDVTATFPLGCFIAVTGVSGSSKSTLITDTLHRKLALVNFTAPKRCRSSIGTSPVSSISTR